MANKVTSPKAAKAASKVLKDGRAARHLKPPQVVHCRRHQASPHQNAAKSKTAKLAFYSTESKLSGLVGWR